MRARKVSCSGCGAPILPGQRWDLDHADDGDPLSYLGPAHARCNRQTLTILKQRLEAASGTAGFAEVVSLAVELARCYACGERKPVGEFPPDRSKASGRMSRCRGCDLERGRRYYAAHRERILARHQPAQPREATCAGCGGTFTPTNGRQLYCDPECRPSKRTGATVTAECGWCSKSFSARSRDRERGGGRFCSRSCALQARNSPATADVVR